MHVYTAERTRVSFMATRDIWREARTTLQHHITIVKPHGPSRDPIVIATRGNRNRRRAAPAFITDTNLILRFIIESMTIIVRTSIP